MAALADLAVGTEQSGRAPSPRTGGRGRCSWATILTPGIHRLTGGMHGAPRGLRQRLWTAHALGGDQRRWSPFPLWMAHRAALTSACLRDAWACRAVDSTMPARGCQSVATLSPKGDGCGQRGTGRHGDHRPPRSTVPRPWGSTRQTDGPRGRTTLSRRRARERGANRAQRTGVRRAGPSGEGLGERGFGERGFGGEGVRRAGLSGEGVRRAGLSRKGRSASR